MDLTITSLFGLQNANLSYRELMGRLGNTAFVIIAALGLAAGAAYQFENAELTVGDTIVLNSASIEVSSDNTMEANLSNVPTIEVDVLAKGNGQ